MGKSLEAAQVSPGKTERARKLRMTGKVKPIPAGHSLSPQAQRLGLLCLLRCLRNVSACGEERPTCTGQVRTPGERVQCFPRAQRENRCLGEDFTVVPGTGKDFGNVKSAPQSTALGKARESRKGRIKGKSNHSARMGLAISTSS